MDDPTRKHPEANARRDNLLDTGWRLRDQIEKQLDMIRKLCRESARQVEESKAILARMVRLRHAKR
jgi:hypothetical protein